MNKFCALILPLLITMMSCDKQKNKTEIATSPALTKVLLTKSIDSTIAATDRRLDVKMKRKYYQTPKGENVTLEKFFDKGDTTKLLKLREEILTGDYKMEVIQYHYLADKLIEIHDFGYDKKCGEKGKQCMVESKYFFDGREQLSSAESRHIEGTDKRLPIIENADFQNFTPEESVLKTKLTRVKTIIDKYQTLPYPKPKS